MNTNDERENITSQWITSLAISVVCCAALFLVFAGYIMDLHGKTANVTVRLEVMQERQNQLVAELDSMRRPIPVTMMAPTQPAPQNGAPAASAAPGAPAANAPIPSANPPSAPATPPPAAQPVLPVAVPVAPPAPGAAPTPVTPSAPAMPAATLAPAPTSPVKR